MSLPTLGTAVRLARQRFAAAGLDDAGHDARLLVLGLLNLPVETLLSDPDRTLDEGSAARIETAVLRRLAHEPVHRILGHREFYGLDLELSKETLEPRPDTEVLVDLALPYLLRIATLKDQPRLLDLGTGTGAIALALLSACRSARGLGVDISPEAASTASHNAGRLGLSDRFEVRVGNWAHGLEGTYDLVVSNPPYIASGVLSQLQPEVRLFDPARALDGGEDGLAAYRVLAQDLPRLLDHGGIVGLEIGYDQKESVVALFAGAGFQLEEAGTDYGGNDRVLIFSKVRDQGTIGGGGGQPAA